MDRHSSMKEQRRYSQDRARKINNGELTNISCGRSESLLGSQGPLQRLLTGDDTQPYEGVGRYSQHSVRNSNKGVLTSGMRVRSERPYRSIWPSQRTRTGIDTQQVVNIETSAELRTITKSPEQQMNFRSSITSQQHEGERRSSQHKGNNFEASDTVNKSQLEDIPTKRNRTLNCNKNYYNLRNWVTKKP